MRFQAISIIILRRISVILKLILSEAMSFCHNIHANIYEIIDENDQNLLLKSLT